MRRSSGTTDCSSTTSRDASTLTSTSPTTTRSTRCRTRRTSRRPSRGLLTGEVGLHYTGRAALARRRRRRERRRLVAGGQREARRNGADHAADSRHARCRISASDPAFVDLAAQRRRRRQRRPQQHARQLLFRRFRQQLCRQRSVQRYREYYSLPGFEIDEISGLNFVREMVEWNLPPIVFESAGTPSFHLTWLRPGVFATALWTDVGNSTQRQNYASVGGQVDLRFSVLHWYDMTLSVGLRGRLPGRQARRHRVDDLAQDHVAASAASPMTRSRAARPRRACCRWRASSRRCSISTATSS